MCTHDHHVGVFGYFWQYGLVVRKSVGAVAGGQIIQVGAAVLCALKATGTVADVGPAADEFKFR